MKKVIGKEKTCAKKPRKKRWSKDDTELFLLSLPTLLWFLIFSYLPMFGVIIAFKVYKLSPGGHGFIYNLLHSEWAGIGNFKYFFTSNSFTMLLRNTILYNIAFIIISASVAVGGALMLSNMRNKRGSKVYQTMMFLPYFMSWVVISYFVYALLTPERGYINGIITALGGERIMWYQESKYWPFILVFLNTWKGMGYGMVLYLASITGIDPSLYEAAVMDGATKSQQARHITLPAIKPVFIMMLILDCGKIFNSDFGLFYQVTGQLPASLYTWLIFIPMVFNGGMLASYVVVNNILKLNNSIWALILPLACSAFSVTICRTFFRTTVPDSIIESAKIDGAGQFRIWSQIVLPISKPVMATIGMFAAFGYWNDWFQASLYIQDPKLQTLQSLLNQMQKNIEYIANNPYGGLSMQEYKLNMPTESVRMAIAIVIIVPIACTYPFFQKYFISGLTIGSVKE